MRAPLPLRATSHDVTSADGTVLRAWSNDADGPPVLLCNGLGTNAHAWPALFRPDCGVHVVSWNHRGVGGSQRPADPDRVGVDAFVEDALAVLDDAGVDAAPVVGWSIGVNTAFELAVRHPDRVTGLLAVAGVPGGTFSSMGAPLQIPRFARRPIAIGVTATLERGGGVLFPITSRLPAVPGFTTGLRHSGFMLPSADPTVVHDAVAEFLTTPVQWYMHLARAAARHERVSLSRVRVPTAFVAGTYDILASARDMRTAADRIPGATYSLLKASHFLPMEKPTEVHALLLDVLRRVDAAAAT